MAYNLPQADYIVRRRKFDSCASLCIPSHFSQVVFQPSSYHKTCWLHLVNLGDEREETAEVPRSGEGKGMPKSSSHENSHIQRTYTPISMRICKTSMQVEVAAGCDDFMKDIHQNHGVPRVHPLWKVEVFHHQSRVMKFVYPKKLPT